MSSDRLKTNGTRLSRLIVDHGGTIFRKFLDHVHPPSTLPAVLNANRTILRRPTNNQQKDLLFPPSGMPPTTSKDYDITLLSILLRYICGLTFPVSAGPWHENPDISKEADLARIKYYRNKVYGHNKSTEVSDADFNFYWSEISGALQRLGVRLGVDIRVDIGVLKTCHLDEDRWIDQLNEWYENDQRIEVLIRSIERDVEEVKTDVKEVKTDVKDVKTDVEEVKTDVKEVKTDVKDVKTGVEDVKTDVEEVKTDVKDVKTDVEEVKTDVKDVKTDVEEVKTDVKDVKTDVEEVKTDVKDVKTDVEEVKTDVKDVKTDVEEVKTDVKDVKTDVEEVKTDVKEVKTDVKEVKTGVEDVKTDVEEVKTDVKEVKTDVKDVKTDVEEVKTDVKDVKTDVSVICAICSAFFLLFLLFCLAQLLLSYVSKEPEYFERQDFSNSDFVGREWVFRQIELDILNASDVRGVVLVADPGWGKSAIMKRLISSPSSSAIIHENIIGYHFCKYNDKSTRDGEQFVKKLVRLIAENIREFPKAVMKDDNCKNNPTECYQKAIVEPLQKLNSIERNISFILIDALDECLEKEERHADSIIVNILTRRFLRLPAWVKLIITSRKHALTSGKISKTNEFAILKINVEDERNLQDLRTYAEQALQSFYTEVPSTKEILPVNRSINMAVEFSKGNFLFVKTIINYWQEYPHKMNAESIPESLEDMYKVSFTERFKKADLIDFEPLFEVLLAANSPPTLLKMGNILSYHNKNYNTRRIVNELSEYFKSDIDQGPLEFHHQFFAEWLVNQTDGSNGITIQKSRGHQYIVDYLFHFYSERETNLTFEELSELCTHILHGEKASLSNVPKLSSLSVSEIRDSWNRSILHDLAEKSDASELIDTLIKQFNDVDILDYDNWTPAINYAVSAGRYENVKIFIDNGANVNRTVKNGRCFPTSLFFTIPHPNHCPWGIVNHCPLSVLAACKGYLKIAKLLVESGANVEEEDEWGWKPLHVAAFMGHFEIVQLYINKAAQPDLITLHHATATNRTEIVRLLLNTGVRDKCLPCKPGNMSWCYMNLTRFHHCICETALYAAVSRNNLEMANLILEYGNASVNCKHGSGRTPLMVALSQKNPQMVELLINEGADINAKCESSRSISDFIYDFAVIGFKSDTLIYCASRDEVACNGSRVIDFAFAHGLWKMIIPLTPKAELNASSSDNVGLSRTTVAAIYDKVDYINASYGNRINSIPNIETVLRYAAVCHSVKTLTHLLNSNDLSKFTVVYEDGKTLLHFATLGSSNITTEAYVTHSCASSKCVCPNMTHSDIVDEKRLETARLLIKVLISFINRQDNYGRTALHYAVVHGSLKLAKYLVTTGADWTIKDQWGDTALEFALRERPLSPKLSCRWTSEKGFQVCDIFDELVSYLLQNSSIKKCDMRAKNLLDSLLDHKLPLSLYTLFKSGLDVNCAQQHFKRILSESVYIDWDRRHWYIFEVFKIFQINVDVVCDVPFKQSELHLMAYVTVKASEVRNLFEPSVYDTPFPLERFVATHPNAVEILNECYDREGYLAIHRAVQGRNLPAVSWFIEIGVDISKKTKSGWTAIALAVRNLYGSDLDNDEGRIFEMLLRKMQEESHTILQCNPELVDLSPLHVAGSRTPVILKMIHSKIPALSLNCTNDDGIQPIYMVYLHHSTDYGIWREDKKAFEDLGLSFETGPPKYPEHEAEHHLIYNQFYYTPQEDLRNVLNHDGLFECPGINDLLPHKSVIQEYIRLKGCTTHCWPSALEVSREFSSNFPYLKIQNVISNPFTDKFIDIAHHMAELRFHLVKMFHFESFRSIAISTMEKKLWRKVTKAHTCTHNCSCFEIMQLLQETFTSEPRRRKVVGGFVAERMGWTDTSYNGDVQYRWPFSFLLKKALRTDETYKYLEILSPLD